MLNKKNIHQILDAIFTVGLGSGFLIALLPHTTHFVAGHTPQPLYAGQMTAGLALAMISLVLLIQHNKALNLPIRK